MNSFEWPLIIYTLCIQSAVGVYAAGAFAVWGESDRKERLRFLWVAAVLGTVGVLASILHMGTPMRALLTMGNLGTSRLGREILFTVLFALFGFTAVLLEWRVIGSRAARNGWAVLTGLVGLALIYVMSMVYRTTMVPAWAHVSTTASFFATTGLIGAVAVFAGLSFFRPDAEPRRMQGLIWSALVMLALQMMTISSRTAYLGGAGEEAQMTAAALSGNMLVLFWARVALVILGAAVFMPWSWFRRGGREWISPAALASLMLGFVGLGELFGRILFYTTRVKIGL